VKPELTLKREPGANFGDGIGTLSGEEQAAQACAGSAGASVARGGDVEANSRGTRN